MFDFMYVLGGTEMLSQANEAATETKRGAGKDLDFGGFGGRGVHPIGIAGLLDACGLNKENLWQRSRGLLAAGVLCPRAALTNDAVEKRINEISQRYPLNDKSKAMGVLVREKRLRGKGVYLFRGDHVIGDCKDLAAFWVDLYLGNTTVPDWTIRGEAMCWSGLTPGNVFVPYVDLDECAPTGSFSVVWGTRVVPCVKAINDALSLLGVDSPRTIVTMNTRPSERAGLDKFSFHLHWPGLGVRTIGMWKNFLATLDDLPRAVDWIIGQDGELQQTPRPGNSSLVDMAVYGGRNQLFRGPYCGKRGDLAAIMYPVSVSDDGCGNYQYRFKDEASGASRESMIDCVLRTRITAFPSEVAILDLPEHVLRRNVSVPAVTLVRPACSAPSVAPMDPTIENIHRFITPFLERFILPEWQNFRHRILVSIGGVAGAVVPTTNLVISHERQAERRGRAFFTVQGDTFCECDARHVHTASPGRIGLVVDYLRATITQTCFVCGPSVVFPVYSFLHTGNQIRIEPRDRCGHSRVSCWSKSASLHQVLLDFYWDKFVYQRSTQLLYVYDDDARVWRANANGNAVVGKLIENVNRRHSEYLNAQRRVFMDSEIARYDNGEIDGSDDEVEDLTDEDDEKQPKRAPRDRAEAVRRIESRARRFVAKRTPFITFTAASRGKLLAELRSFVVHTEAVIMNPHENLIPMRNGQCVDVFTGLITDMEPRHLFTSMVDAQFNPEDPNIPTINEWFDEISTGDKAKAVYLKRIGAYCFTFLVHDRKYVILVGSGKNGKGMFKEFIVLISNGPSGYESRVKMLNGTFWSARANANSSPEAPTPEAFDMRNTTFFYTDDIGPVALDTAKLKRVVGGEDQSARGLYGDPCVVKPRGKVMHTSNFDPAGPGDDQAYWERTVVVKMRTKYVEDASQVDKSKYRFLKDQAVYRRLLTMTDAFFTITVQELIAYYKTVTSVGSGNSPLLVSFPVPPEIQAATAEAKEKRLPLAAFMRIAMEDVKEPLYFASLTETFDNYMMYLRNCNETAIAKMTTSAKFEELLALALDIRVVHMQGRALVEGKRLVKPITEHPSTHQYTGFVHSS